MWDPGGVQDQAGPCCHPCPGVRPGAGMLESHRHHLLLGHRDTGHCHSPAGMCLLSLSGHPGTGYHRILASQVPLQQVTAPRRDGADVALHSGVGAEPRPVSRRRNSLQEPPPFLSKTPDPSLCSGTPPWAGCAVQNVGSDAVDELEGLWLGCLGVVSCSISWQEQAESPLPSAARAASPWRGAKNRLVSIFAIFP